MNQQQAKELFVYDPETGAITWRTARPGVPAGKIAGALSTRGHRMIMAKGERISGSHIAWLYMTGQMPDRPVTYLDGNNQNLAWRNLTLTAKPEAPTAENIKQLFHYNPDTGLLTRRVTTGSHAMAGTPAGTYNNGYLNVKIAGKMYKGHRLAWLYMTGEWPTGEIDHIDNDPSNNRWSNLREATSSQNKCNRTYANKTGHRGVHKTPAGTYVAEVQADGVRRKLGTFKSAEQAAAAAAQARAELHGAFARL